MRARNIKPGFFQNEDLAEVSITARLLFIGLWMVADREGRMEDRPRRIKFELFPMDDIDIEAELGSLEEWGFVRRYEVDGQAFIQILNFDKHQNPHHNEKASDIPPPCSTKVESASDQGRKQVQPREEAHLADSLNPDSLNEESGNQEEAAALEERTATAPAAEIPVTELTNPEEYAVVKVLRQTRGMATVPEVDIARHLRELQEARGSPLSGEALMFECIKFRDHWTAKRDNQPWETRWKGWRKALTAWINRADEHRANGSGYRPRNVPDFSGIDEFDAELAALERGGRS